MARYKRYDYTQMAMVAVDFQRQILPGTFEHTLSRLIDEKFSLEVFEERYDNDDNGAPAYDPAICSRSSCLPTREGSPLAGRSATFVSTT